jgi:hypothetical protein
LPLKILYELGKPQKTHFEVFIQEKNENFGGGEKSHRGWEENFFLHLLAAIPKTERGLGKTYVT